MILAENYYDLYDDQVRDDNHNIIIYKGTQYWGSGAEVTCTAKVKDHEVREGVKQTIIQRPTKVKVNGEDY